MSTIGHETVRKEHTRLVENVDARYIADYLYEKDFLTPEILEYVTDEDRPSRDRCRRLLLELNKHQFVLAPLINALNYENTFPHLCTELLVTLSEIVTTPRRQPRRLSLSLTGNDDDFIGICNPSREIKRTVFTKEHFLATKLYCKMRRLLNQGKHMLHEFDDELYRYQELWEQNQDDALRRHLVANRYFEIKILQIRKLSESGAEDNTVRSLFSDTAQLVPYTSHPCASVTSLLTIYAHALLTARKPCEEVLSVLNEAKSNFPFLPGCRETSLVLITEFKVYWQLYEKSSDTVTKKELLQKAAAAAMHFAVDEELNEDLTYKLYINRGLQFLQTLANLGLGYTLRNIRHDCVTKENIQNALSFLKTVDEGEGWQQMEVRWRMSFYVAKSKINFVEGNIKEAVELAESALELSNSVHFKEEHENIQEFVRFISHSTTEHQHSQGVENNTENSSDSTDGSDSQNQSEVLDKHCKISSVEHNKRDDSRTGNQSEQCGKSLWKFDACCADLFDTVTPCKHWYSSRMLQAIGLLVLLTLLPWIYSVL
ncbi:uncharacterized protein LOC117341125 [Pecten maximus]|uniref:uncharacterized protein LOC117341125 n=1 Tax=Pecten maximus TaxID=6579 RepID=UPI0014588D92|nr:uncharacterized protein LOC117341125 [Pecten maximus]XP_033758855.1 uncharacterized protein LOC117341125 [Pecten maximus]